MMQLDEFIEATNILERYYGKELSTEQMKIMYDILKDFGVERYKKVLVKCLKTCKYMPKIADIFAANNELSGQVQQEENTVKETCNKCEGTGYVFYTKFLVNGTTRYPYTYVSRCTCKNSRYANQQVPTYQEVGISIGTRSEQIKDKMRCIEIIKK